MFDAQQGWKRQTLAASILSFESEPPTLGMALATEKFAGANFSAKRREEKRRKEKRRKEKKREEKRREEKRREEKRRMPLRGLFTCLRRS